jgi:hypothetical protein
MCFAVTPVHLYIGGAQIPVGKKSATDFVLKYIRIFISSTLRPYNKCCTLTIEMLMQIIN